MTLSCPWDFLTPQEYNFCETQVCGWINEPANTLSNVGYLLVSIFIFRSVTPEKGMKHFFSGALFALFVASTIFHGTGSAAGKMMDVSAMFIISMGILAIGVRRYFGWDNKKIIWFYSVGLLMSLTFLFVYKFGNVLFLSELVFASLFEILAHRRGRSSLNKKYFFRALGSMALAMVIWILDVKKILCWPDVHYFSGHGVWHLLTAIAMGFLFLAYVTAKENGDRSPR